MLPDLCIDFSRCRSGGLLFPSLSEFSTVYCDAHKGFGIVNKAEIDVFLAVSCFFDDPVDVGNLISGSSAFSKTGWNLHHLKNLQIMCDGEVVEEKEPSCTVGGNANTAVLLLGNTLRTP